MQITHHLALPLLMPAQAQKHVTHNEALVALDALVQLSVLAADLAEPPEAPEAGARYLVAAGAEGDWLGQSGRIALYDGQGWQFFTPELGWRCFVENLGRDLVLTEAGWGAIELRAPKLGINAAPDSINRLSLAAPASLFNHAGAGHQLKLNKAASADTASLLFQKGFSGRAEMGLAGEDDFSLKVSGDGAGWQIALRADGETGRVVFPQGIEIKGLAAGEALVQTPFDTTNGLLTCTGWMGLGRETGLEAEDIDALAATGFFLSPEGSGNHAPSTAVHAILHQQIDAAKALQIAWGPSGESFQRQRLAGEWSSWKRILSQNAILGTTGETAGQPTGALFERGSNANGIFSRFADGTLICRSPALSLQANSAAGAIFKSGDLSWTFPAPFVGAAVIAVSAASGWANGRQSAADTAQLTAYSATSMSAAVTCHAMAWGRWF